MRRLGAGLLVLTMGLTLFLASLPATVQAAPALVQTANTAIHNSTTVTATFAAAATANNLLIAICGAESTAITGPSGFSTAINQSGTPSQGIFYKIAAGGETGISCTSTNTFMGIHIYEYSGMQTSSVLEGTPGSNTGTSTAPTTGSTTTTTAETLLIGGITLDGQATYSAWTNTFTEQNDFLIAAGTPGSRHAFGGATRSVVSAGTYSTGATSTVNGVWRGQIAAFKTAIGALSVDIVNASGVSVGSPSVGLSATASSVDCATTTGTLGSSAERIRVSNTTAVPQWTVAIAATAGATSTWTSGGNTFDFNDGSGAPAGCADGGDADAQAGRMTLNASAGTSTPQSGCNNTGVTLGSSSSFAQGTTDSITLISASPSAGTNCYWDLTGVSVSQTVPAAQAAGTYTINLTLTVTAT